MKGSTELFLLGALNIGVGLVPPVDWTSCVSFFCAVAALTLGSVLRSEGK